jgi:hypothetical protein
VMIMSDNRDNSGYRGSSSKAKAADRAIQTVNKITTLGVALPRTEQGIGKQCKLLGATHQDHE